jgi:hypothetical protein
MSETAKIVINRSYGGFSLSKTAYERYAQIKGWRYEGEDSYGFFFDENGIKHTWYDLERIDPILIQVVEELGEEANGMCAKLVIEEIEKGTRYRIDEYDGMESIETRDDIDWRIA